MGARPGFARFGRLVIVPVTVAALLTQFAPAAHADDPYAELAKQQDKLKYIQSQAAQAKNQFAQVTWQAAEAEEMLKQADQELAVANSQLQVIQTEYEVADKELKKVEADLKVAQDRYNTRKELLARRVRAINEEGRVNYLGVLLGATSFKDFISRFDMLKMIVKQDSVLFAQIRQDKADLEVKQAQAEQRKTQVAALKMQAEQNKSQVEQKRNQRQVASRTLDTRKRELASMVAQMEEEQEALVQKIASIQRQLNRKGGPFQPIPPLKSYTITDRFGMRINPITGQWSQHKGTDFAAPTGAPVHAIEAGVVIVAGWSDVYGNYIIIDHGGGISSLYGHNSQLLVGVNDTVVQDQVIAKVGSTGWATGPHSHLEIRVNGEVQNPETYLGL